MDGTCVIKTEFLIIDEIGLASNEYSGEISA
jgi:hypothetical protein